VDTDVLPHEGVSNPGVPKGAPAPEVSVAFATDPVKLGLGETANLPTECAEAEGNRQRA